MQNPGRHSHVTGSHSQQKRMKPQEGRPKQPHTPPALHMRGAGHVPQVPPQPSGPQFRPAQFGTHTGTQVPDPLHCPDPPPGGVHGVPNG